MKIPTDLEVSNSYKKGETRAHYKTYPTVTRFEIPQNMNVPKP